MFPRLPGQPAAPAPRTVWEAVRGSPAPGRSVRTRGTPGTSRLRGAVTRDGHEATTFVGRRQELEELHRALASARSVTLIGVGGAGKTRLAQQLVREAAQRHDGLDGRVWLVDLGELHDPGMVQVAVATEMGIRPTPGERQVARICELLGDEPALLVLDNCEHWSATCAYLVLDLLSSCPALSVVATSRQALGIAGEHVYRVPPMPVPDLSDPLRARTSPTASAWRCSWTAPRQALPGFELTDANAEGVARLCVALEGIPLALELAAARSRVLSPEACSRGSSSATTCSAVGTSTSPNRQRSIVASVTWSHELCTAEEQLLWARLSVFTGGFDLDAAEYVCADEGLPTGDILDVLAYLVDKSLVSRDPGEASRTSGCSRRSGSSAPHDWQPSETRHLWAGRHQDWFAGQARHFHDRWVGPDQRS